MSTVHICYTDVAAEVALVEHSGKLDLSVDDGLGNGVDINDLTPEQVARMAIKMLKAAYYQDEEAVQIAARESREQYELGIKL
jgi:hypothetical protein